jgi:hypothetical protein
MRPLPRIRISQWTPRPADPVTVNAALWKMETETARHFDVSIGVGIRIPRRLGNKR